MRTSTVLWRSLLGVAAFAALTGAHADNTIPDVSLDPDEALTVVYAVYGGDTYDKTAAHYVNVTDKVSDLLKKSPAGFSATEDVIIGKHETDLVPSLIVVYNYEQQSYFYNIPEGGGTVSVAKLKSWAKAHNTDHQLALIGAPVDAPDGGDFHVVFAAYGVGDTFFNATDPVRKLIHDQPDGFIPTDDAMGGDPHPGWGKELIVIFDDSSGRHLYALFNIGPKVSRDALLDSAKSK